jgi:orotidine-5'-phosphate decarboxylase
LATGVDGVVSSGMEAEMLRNHLDHKLLVVTPGIRPVDGAMDDQARTGTPRGALADGADILVIGRPVTHAADPVAAIRAIRGLA